MTEILIFAGSAEGHDLAKALTKSLNLRGQRVRAVLPAALRHDPGGVPYEIAGEWSAAIAAEGQGPVILATHPGDPTLRGDLALVCASAGRPLLHLCRPAWVPGPEDRWHLLGADTDLPGPIPQGARVFVGLGRAVTRLQERLAGRYLIVRQLSPVESAFVGEGQYLVGTPPFSVTQEIETLRAQRIDWLLVRNAGGGGGWPKLAAARALGLPVAMLPRPPLMPGVPVVEDVNAALTWLAGTGFFRNSDAIFARNRAPEVS